MKTRISLTCLVLLLTFITTWAQSPVGKWKTIDDKSGDARSIVEIFEKDGKVYGKIIKLFLSPDEEQDPVCEECEGKLKNQKVIGMTVINDLKKDDDEWASGTILDPENGKVYRCRIWVEDGKLQVRGYVAFFFRTQTWLPYDGK